MTPRAPVLRPRGPCANTAAAPTPTGGRPPSPPGIPAPALADPNFLILGLFYLPSNHQVNHTAPSSRDLRHTQVSSPLPCVARPAARLHLGSPDPPSKTDCKAALFERPTPPQPSKIIPFSSALHCSVQTPLCVNCVVLQLVGGFFVWPPNAGHFARINGLLTPFVHPHVHSTVLGTGHSVSDEGLSVSASQNLESVTECF